MAGLNEKKEIREVTLSSGEIITGEILNSGLNDLQLLGQEGEIFLLRKTQNQGWRRVGSQQDWATYHGVPEGNRYSTLTGVNKSNVQGLAPAWIFSMGGGEAQTTPLVFEGLMYISNDNEVFALDAVTGEILWQFPANQVWKASPMTYEFDHQQYIAIAIGETITAFKVME